MKFLILLMTLLIGLTVFADGQHGHEHDSKDGEHQEEGHDEDHEESHEDKEASSVVGPDKGLTAKSEHGFKLSVEAEKAFDLKYQAYSGETFEAPVATLVEIKNSRYIYRVHEGWIKKVPAQVLKKTASSVFLKVLGLEAGDQILIQGTGFVRTAEMVAEEGVSHGHSH